MSSPQLSDAALVRSARRGDHAAWKVLFDRHDWLIRAVCHAHRLGPADVDDVRATTWLRAVEHIERIREPHKLGAWLAAVARNECLRALRHRTRVRPFADGLEHKVSDPSPAPETMVLAAERRAAVHRAVRKLSPRDRAFLDRVFDETEPSYDEIAGALGMPVGSIGPTRGRVLERMRRNAQVATLMLAT
jgi:RNA polymerase sigma factor (sigma-70 family)